MQYPRKELCIQQQNFVVVNEINFLCPFGRFKSDNFFLALQRVIWSHIGAVVVNAFPLLRHVLVLIIIFVWTIVALLTFQQNKSVMGLIALIYQKKTKGFLCRCFLLSLLFSSSILFCLCLHKGCATTQSTTTIAG